MLKIENVEVLGWDHAIRGMRNPKNSWDRSDSFVCESEAEMTNEEIDATCGICTMKEFCPSNSDDDVFVVGPNDHKLMMTLASGGPVHAKYRRMITVYLDITAPLYWWKEFDTYKVGTVANSCSTMHKIHAKEFELSDFSTEHLISDWVGDNNDAMYYWRREGDDLDTFASPMDGLRVIIGLLNANREAYLKTQKKPMKEEAKRAALMKKYWWQMIQLLPTSYNQKRTVMLNYEVLHNIYESRRHHKLDEWHTLCDWIEKLPYSELIIGEKKDGNNA